MRGNAYFYRLVVAIIALIILLYAPLYFAYYKYLSLYLLDTNLRQFNATDLLTLGADIQTDSQLIENQVVDAEHGQLSLGTEPEAVLKNTPLRWTPASPSVELGSARLSKAEYQEIALVFQTDWLCSLLPIAAPDTDAVTPDEWHISIADDKVKEKVDELAKAGILLIDTKIASAENECDKGEYQKFKTENIQLSDEVVGDLEFFIDRKSGQISRIVLPEPKYTEVTMNAQTCGLDPAPVRFTYKTESHSPTTIQINGLQFRRKVSPNSVHVLDVYRFIFKNIWF